jgi:integrase
MGAAPKGRRARLRHAGWVPWATVGDFHPKVVSEHLGHATVSITLDIYSHAIPAMQEEAAVRIAGLAFAAK